MRSSEFPSLLLVEDDPVLGPLIVELLAQDFAVTLAADGRAGLHMGLTRNWDVMLIDRGLPGLDGIALITALRAEGISAPILILTALGATQDKVRGLDAGANDYVTKPFDVMELTARLRAQTRSYTTAPRTVVIGDWELDVAARTVRSVHGRIASLTARETELLAVLASDAEKVFTREDLIEAMFQSTDLPGVVDTYVHHLRRKISRSVIRTVHGVGYQIGKAHD